MSSTINPPTHFSAWHRRENFFLLLWIIAAKLNVEKLIRGFENMLNGLAYKIGLTGKFAVDAKNGPVVVQSAYVLYLSPDNMGETGGIVADIVKFSQYFRKFNEFQRYYSVRRTLFPTSLPTFTLAEVFAKMPSDEILIEIKATAWKSVKL